MFMPEESSGYGTVIAAAIGAAATLVVSLIKRQPADNSVARAVSLDRTQQAIIEGLRQELREAKTACSTWEGRARRVDDIAHDLRHQIANTCMRMGLADTVIPHIPKLEDPL